MSISQTIMKHHRKTDFFNKIFTFIKFLSISIRKSFTNEEIFDQFRHNQQILILIFHKKILIFDQSLMIKLPNAQINIIDIITIYSMQLLKALLPKRKENRPKKGFSKTIQIFQHNFKLKYVGRLK